MNEQLTIDDLEEEEEEELPDDYDFVKDMEQLHRERGAVWSKLENKRPANRPVNSGNSPTYLSATDAGFKDSRDSTTCGRDN